MQRTVSKVSIGINQSRTTVRYTSEQCEPDTIRSNMERIALLKTLTDTPELQNCGFTPFQKLSMRHTGECWLIELEATVVE